MRLAGVEAGIEMGEGDRDQPLGAHDLRRLDDEARGKLHGLAVLAGKLRAV